MIYINYWTILPVCCIFCIFVEVVCFYLWKKKYRYHRKLKPLNLVLNLGITGILSGVAFSLVMLLFVPKVYEMKSGDYSTKYFISKDVVRQIGKTYIHNLSGTSIELLKIQYSSEIQNYIGLGGEYESYTINDGELYEFNRSLEGYNETPDKSVRSHWLLLLFGEYRWYAYSKPKGFILK